MTSAAPVVVLLDDARDFRDGRACHTVRSSQTALALLETLDRVDELWLDYDLVGDDTAQPVVNHLVARAAAGTPFPERQVLVHSSNVRHGHRIAAELTAAGYPTRRNFAKIFTRAPLEAGRYQPG